MNKFPAPWQVGPHYHTDIHSPHGFVAECRPMNSPSAVANAEFIVRACNCHDELLAALKSVVGHGYCENTSSAAGQDYVAKSAIAKVRAAIAKAEGR